MVELIGKHPPVNVLRSSVDVSALGMSDDEDEADIYGNDVDEKEAMARMKIICQFAREVLLSHVKSDHNLTVYRKWDVSSWCFFVQMICKNLHTFILLSSSFLIAGSISFPATLFSRRLSTSPVPRKYEDSAVKKRRPKKSIGDYVKAKQKDEEGMSENEEPEEDDEDSSKKSESEDDKSVDDEKSEDSIREQKKDETFERSPSPSASASPFSNDNDGGGDFANDFGDVSPISKAAESPVVDSSAPKGRTKKRSSTVSTKAKAKPTKQSKTSSKNSSSKKRKIDVFDEFLSPETDGGDSDAASESPVRGKSNSLAKKSRKSTPSTKTTSAKKKARGATPVSIPKQIRLKSIDPNSASSGSTAPSKRKGAATKKKQVAAKKVKKSAVAVEKKDALDFSDSPVKPKASAAGRSRKKSSAKKAPAKKATKTKVSVGGSKAKVAAGKRSSGGRGKTQVSASSPSTTSEASSKASPRRSARRSTRVR